MIPPTAEGVHDGGKKGRGGGIGMILFGKAPTLQFATGTV